MGQGQSAGGFPGGPGGGGDKKEVRNERALCFFFSMGSRDKKTPGAGSAWGSWPAHRPHMGA
jgi:hypothetical protein